MSNEIRRSNLDENETLEDLQLCVVLSIQIVVALAPSLKRQGWPDAKDCHANACRCVGSPFNARSRMGCKVFNICSLRCTSPSISNEKDDVELLRGPSQCADVVSDLSGRWRFMASPDPRRRIKPKRQTPTSDNITTSSTLPRSASQPSSL